MMRGLLLSIALLAACQAPATHQDRDQSDAMLAVCRLQEAAWNRGDLASFMREGYLRSPELTFYSGGRVTRGFDEMLDHYRKSYEADGKEMGRLAFSDLDTILLGQSSGIVRGRWKLDNDRQPDVEGLFTLVMRRTADGWRIVHDHTSVASPR